MHGLLPDVFLLAALAIGMWLLSLARRDASLMDIAWGPAFLLLGGLHALQAGLHARGALVLALVGLWGLRLAWHIGSRHRGEDKRYRRWRQAHGSAWWWRSLFTVFLLQAALVWVLGQALVQAIRLGPGDLQGLDLLALVVALAGLGLESLADRQLARFRRAGSPGPCDTGLWRYSRHPNYFGEALFWWGIYLAALSAGAGWTVFAPLGITALLRWGSGVPLLERSLANRPGWAEYARRTSPFLPWRPKP
jgi:steroid 5-alpha reductase family enzyme